MSQIAADERSSPRRRLADSPTSWKLGTLIVVISTRLWQLLGLLDPIILSYPTQILASAWQLGVVDNVLLPAFSATLQAFAVGVVIATVLGIGLGFLMGRSKYGRGAPQAVCVRAVRDSSHRPGSAAGLALPGIGFEMRVVVVGVERDDSDRGQRLPGRPIHGTPTTTKRHVVFVASRMQSVRTVVIPAMVPYVFTGLRIGISTAALVGVIVAEMTAAVSGTGWLLIELGQFFQTANVLVPTILLGILGIVLICSFFIWFSTGLRRGRSPRSVHEHDPDRSVEALIDNAEPDHALLTLQTR